MLKRGGTLVSIVDQPSPERAAALGLHGVFFIVEPNRTQLMEIAHLIDGGRLRSFIDQVFPLEQAQQAFEYGLRGHSMGKIVLQIAERGAAAVT